MKKFLLSLCLTMLSVVGAWAQDGPSVTVDPSSLEIEQGGVAYVIPTWKGFTPKAEDITFTYTTDDESVDASSLLNAVVDTQWPHQNEIKVSSIGGPGAVVVRVTGTQYGVWNGTASVDITEWTEFTVNITPMKGVVLTSGPAEGEYTITLNDAGNMGRNLGNQWQAQWELKVTEWNDVSFESLKKATKIHIAGNVNNADMQVFTGIFGNSKDLTEIDMSGATMTEAITVTDPTNNDLMQHSFINPKAYDQFKYVTTLSLPNPATGVENGTVLPTQFGFWCQNVKNVTVPEGWTRLGTLADDGEGFVMGDKGPNGAFNASASTIENISLPSTLIIEPNMFNAQALKNITLAEGTTAIGAYSFDNCEQLQTVNFPASLETIGESAFRGCKALQEVDMQECTNLTVIPANAFQDCYLMAKLNLPPNLVTVGENAFQHFKTVKVIIFPKTLDRIEAGAFQNYGGSNSLTDVFFTGTDHTPSYVDAYAFTANTQMGNNTLIDTEELLQDGTPAISNGTITRYSYRNGLDDNGQPFLTTIMHFPVGYTKYYTDPTRVYSDAGRNTYVAPTDGSNVLNPNRKADFNYQPEGWTDEFIAIIKGECTKLNEEFSKLSVGEDVARDSQGNEIHNYINGGYSDRTYGDAKIWPSQQQMADGYTISHVGYLWDGTEMEDWQKDIRGLYQFINAFGDAPADPYYWDFGTKYQKDKWYTFCVPFNMSVEEIENVFGDGTQVCRFSNVDRLTPNPDTRKNEVILVFRKSVMKEGGYTEKEIYPEVTATTTGILHHVPYMIKPGGDATDNEAQFQEDGSRRLPNFNRVGGVMINETVVKDDYLYSFEGTLERIPLLNHVYFLALDKNTGDHKFFFSHNATGYLNANTASVRVRLKGDGKDMGDDDWADFFNTTTGAGSTDATGSEEGGEDAPAVTSNAKLFSFFGDEAGVTAIENVTIVCGNDVVDNKVYTVGGQLINGNKLPAGLYIKNGKKFIVK
ncbi:MAG: leucine-rich repeat domain-containing protein [Bacteroidaceae bacterium]|nr:leucine-rich repeat domain-containing protein [Bacteroidaceae bacterium]